MPRSKELNATLDSRFWEITDRNNSFEWIKLQSGFTFYLPFKKTKVWNKWAENSFTLSKSIRLCIRKGKLFVEFFFISQPLNIQGKRDRIRAQNCLAKGAVCIKIYTTLRHLVECQVGKGKR